MPVSSEAAGPATLAWTGVETAFNPGFAANAAADVRLYHRLAGGTLSALVLNVHFSVTLGPDKAVTIVPIAGAMPAAPATLIAVRVTPALQPTDFANLSSYVPQIHTDRHDAAAMRTAEWRRDLLRTLRLPADLGFAELPPKANLALRDFQFDGDGNPYFPPLAPAPQTALTGQIYETRNAVTTVSIAVTVLVIAVLGLATAGDSPPAYYSRAASEPVHAAKVQSVDGAWWELQRGAHAVDVRQFGVKFDGVTDDTAKWNDVIAAINGGHYRSFLMPPLTSLISAKLNPITASGWSLDGCGFDATQIHMAAGAGIVGTFFQIGATPDPDKRAGQWQMSGFGLTCLNKLSLNGTQNCFDVRNSRAGTLANIKVTDVNGLVHVGSTADTTQSGRLALYRCYVDAWTPAGGKILDLQSSTGLHGLLCYFAGSPADGSASSAFRGMYVHPAATDISDTSLFVGCHWNFGGPDPLYNIEYDFTNSSIGGQRFVNCVFDQAVAGANIYIHCDAAPAAHAKFTATFGSCISDGSTNAVCLLVDNTGNKPLALDWTSGMMSTNGNSGVGVKVTGGNPVKVTINGTQISSRHGGTPGAAIVIGAGVSGVKVIGNTARAGIDGAGNPFTNYSHLVEFVGDASNCIISGNDAKDCTTGLIKFPSGGLTPAAAASNIVRENIAPAGGQPPQNEIVTSAATPTAILSIPLKDNSTSHVRTRVTARRSSTDRQSFELIGTWYRAGAGAVKQGETSLVHPSAILSGSATYDPPSLADGAGTTTTVTVTGAALGDFVEAVSFSLDLQGIVVTGYVSAADTVAVRFQNESGGVVDLGSGTLRARVRRQAPTAWQIAQVANGNNVDIQVTGAAASIRWGASAEIETVPV